MGTLEAKKQCLFSRVPMGGFEATAFENCSYALNLGYSVSPREETGDETERSCHKTDKTLWTNQVNDKSDNLMKKLSGDLEDGADSCGRSWFSILSLGDVSEF